jgi:hypothetical protein
MDEIIVYFETVLGWLVIDERQPDPDLNHDLDWRQK